MNRFKKHLVPLSVVVFSLMVLAGCSLFSSGEPTPPGDPGDPGEPPVDDPEFIQFYDFADVELGQLTELEGFTITNPNGERGDIEIVADSGTESGKALHMKTVTWSEEKKPSMSVRFPVWDIPSPDVEVIAYEYKLKHESGTAGMYLYTNDGDHRIILRPIGDGKINWHASMDGYTGSNIEGLQPGWNTIRVIADRTTRSGDLYINDMENPVATELPFQREVTTWENMKFILTHETHASQIREAYYGDFKVWVVR